MVNKDLNKEQKRKLGVPFNPDYLDFKKGVESGREVEGERIYNWFMEEIKYHRLTPKSKLAVALEMVFNHLYQHKDFSISQPAELIHQPMMRGDTVNKKGH